METTPRSDPIRVQQRRTKGWRKPENTVSVARPGPWGNPWRVGESALIEWPYGAPTGATVQVREVPITAALAVELYRIAIAPAADEARAELRGKNLMCFCPLDQPCHADVLLELANQGGSDARPTEALERAMLEYARAIRGDWSDFDGRSEQNVIESWVAEMSRPSGRTLEQWRDHLGICPDGNGHWAGFRWGHCRKEDCPISASREGNRP